MIENNPLLETKELPGVQVVRDRPEEQDAFAKDEQQSKIDQRLEEKKLKQTEKLIKSIMDLDKRFKKTEADSAKTEKKLEGAGFFAKLKAEAKNSAKGLAATTFSKKGMLNLIGLREDTLVGKALHSTIDEKQTQIEERTKFKNNIEKYSSTGREMAGQIAAETDPKKKLILEKQLTQYTIEQLDVRKEREKEILEIKRQQKEAEELGGGATITPEQKARLATLQHEQESQFSEKPVVKPKQAQTPTQVTKQEYSETSIEGRPLTAAELNDIIITLAKKGDVVNQAINNTNQMTGSVMSPLAEKSLEAGVYQGMSEEILALNKEQLEELRKLVRNSKKSEEEQLEATKPKTDTVVNAIAEKSAPKSSVTNIIDMIKNMGIEKITKVMGPVTKIMSTIGPRLLALAGPAAGVAAAGAAGYAFGKTVVAPALDAGAAAITGDKEDTLGTASYKAVDTIVGAFGYSDKAKLDKAEKQSEIDLVVKKTKAGETVSKPLLEKVKSYRDELTPEELKVVYSAKVTPTSAIVMPKTEVSNSETSVVKSEISRSDSTIRELQATTLERNNQENTRLDIEREMQDKEKAVASTTVVSPTTVNNSSKIIKNQPPVRNVDSSFNMRLNASFS